MTGPKQPARRPASSGPSRRTQLLIAAAAAVVAVIVLIGAGALLRRDQGDSAGVTGIGTQVQSERNVRGSPSAPLVLVEYSDFQ